jgi:hypothetical protein
MLLFSGATLYFPDQFGRVESLRQLNVYSGPLEKLTVTSKSGSTETPAARASSVIPSRAEDSVNQSQLRSFQTMLNACIELVAQLLGIDRLTDGNDLCARRPIVPLPQFRVSLNEDTVGRELRKLGYRKLSGRPRHHAQEPGSLETFKKTSPPLWRRSVRVSTMASA